MYILGGEETDRVPTVVLGVGGCFFSFFLSFLDGIFLILPD
jgi:hypothetical protein